MYGLLLILKFYEFFLSFEGHIYSIGHFAADSFIRDNEFHFLIEIYGRNYIEQSYSSIL